MKYPALRFSPVAEVVRRGAIVLAITAAACTEPANPSESTAAPALAAPASADLSVGSELGHLRAATAKYHKFEDAKQAGYSVELTPCMADAALGGMGFHYGKASAIDATVNTLEPEVLLFEPQKNGKYKLVGVEFIVPYTLRPRSGPAPTAFGQTFKQNDVFQLWALHAWIWQHNPAGMFADWNPTVNCSAAPAVAGASAHGH